MAKVSPIKLNFNAGEFAVTVEGRVDLDRHPSSMRVMRNCIATPQGPCIRRSGTVFVGPAFKHDTRSGLISFIFSDEQAQILEFADEKIRFVSEDGFQVFAPVAITSVVTASPFKFTSAALAAAGGALGDQVILDGFANNLNVNGEVGNVTAVAGNDFTVDIAYAGPTGAVSATVAKLYEVVSPYGEADVRNVVAVQSIDVLYLFCKGYRTRKLSRFGGYDWRLTDVSFVDGPFEAEDPDISILTPNVRGIATNTHTGASTATPSNTGTASASSELDGGRAAWKAFDDDKSTHWYSNTEQTGWLRYSFLVPTVIEGYIVYMAKRNDSSSADTPKDWAPSTWTFEGSLNGTTWFVLDERFEYPSYKNFRSQYIKMNNKIAYNHYRLNTESVGAAGSFKPRVAQLVLRKAGDVFITLTASATIGINKGQGFLSTDVGRALRIYQNDGFWRPVEITTVTDATHIIVKLQNEPLYDLQPIRRWRMGSFSDTTGWPVCGAFWNDRLAVGGVAEFPTLIATSKVGVYETFSPTDPDGTVIDDNGIASKLNSRTAAQVRWLVGDKSGLLIGTGDSEWILKAATEAQAFSARNQKADESTARGSAAIQPVKIDRQVIFVQASRRTVREYAYVFESDGFKSPSMSLFAPHLGVPPFAQMAYAAEPHSIVWFRRDDGTIAGLTYQRDENVVGWHRHDFGGVVESVACIPSEPDAQNALWMVIRRTINGQTRRYIERMFRFWDYDSTIATSHYVDCGLRDEPSVPTTDVYGLLHLEGKAVCGVADDRPFGMAEVITVVNGHVTLPFEAEEYIVLGLAFETYAETQRPNDGAADGTAQGKTARTNQLVPFLWESAKGELGVYNEDQKQDEFMDITYPYDASAPLPLEAFLTTGMLDIHVLPPNYSVRKTLIFRQRWPLPFNVIALMPQMTVQDR